MKESEDYSKTLTDIRNLMHASAKFHSISGLASISAGIAALAGVVAFYLHFGFGLFDPFIFQDYRTLPYLMADGAIVLAVSLVLAFVFTLRNMKRQGEKRSSPAFARTLLYWSVPMITGGIILMGALQPNSSILFPVCIALTLVFFGLALVSAARYTFNLLFWQGIAEIMLGLAGIFLWKYSLVFWAAGFGILNIVTGLIIYFRYEKNKESNLQ